MTEKKMSGLAKVLALGSMSDLERKVFLAESVPPPPLLGLALPVTSGDVSSGEFEAFVDLMSKAVGFRQLSTSELQEVLAAGMGYASFDAMTRGEGELASQSDMPAHWFAALDVIAWRMYRTGKVGLREACTAIHGGLEGTAMSLRLKYSEMGQLKGGSQTADRQAALTSVWRKWSDVERLANGRVRLKWAAEIAWLAASRCWTEGCGVSREEVNAEILRGGDMTTEELFDCSWMFSSYAWPTGLLPLQYNDQTGRLVGYGWAWSEIDVRTACVFGSAEAFKASALALWDHKPVGHLGLKQIPKTLVEVEFKNPWDPRDFEKARSAEWKEIVEWEQRNRDNTPWMQVHQTDGTQLNLGRDIELSGDRWTGQLRKRPDIEGVLGLKFPSMYEVVAREHDIPWLQEKVPFAIEHADYEVVCKMCMAFDELREKERDRLKQRQASTELSKALKQSVTHHRESISTSSAAILEEPSGLVGDFDMPQAGAEMEDVYPELQSLTAKGRGEYALAFYGKNGLRHDKKHLQRDNSFMAYAVLRNLGIDVDCATWDDHLVIWGLVRRLPRETWSDEAARRKLAADAMQLVQALQWSRAILEELDDSMSKSRLSELGLGGNNVQKVVAH